MNGKLQTAVILIRKNVLQISWHNIFKIVVLVTVNIYKTSQDLKCPVKLSD